MSLTQIHVALGAMLSFTAAIIMYTMLIAAKRGHSQFWHTSTWLVAGLFLITGAAFFCAPFYHYDPLYAEWGFDFVALLKIVLDFVNFFKAIDLPPAETPAQKEEAAATRRQSVLTLIIGLSVALLIVIIYAVLQNRYAGTPAQTAEVVEAQGSKTRNHIDEVLTPLIDEVKAIRQEQIADRVILAETTKRSLANEARSKETNSYLASLVVRFGKWSVNIEQAIERTRKTIASPPPITSDTTSKLTPDRVKNFTTPVDLRKRRKPVSFVGPDSTAYFANK